jgi:hypothetical protein
VRKRPWVWVNKNMSDITQRLRDLGGHMINAADRREAADEIDRWRAAAMGDAEAKTGVIAQMSAKLEIQTAEIARLKQALGFYAERENWLDEQVDYGGNYTSVANSARALDGGKAARAALAETG